MENEKTPHRVQPGRGLDHQGKAHTRLNTGIRGRASVGPVDLDAARAALACIPPDLSRADWVRTLAAAKAAGLDEADAVAWSSGAASYDTRDHRDVWRSLSADGGIGPGTLFYIAKEHGYRPDPAAPRPPPPTAAELARRQAERQARAEAEAAEKQARHEAAALDARQRLAAAEPADPAHPYMRRKGVMPIADMRQEGGALLVPVVAPDGEVRGLQVITTDGAKKFSKGTASAGALWWARPPSADPAGRIYVVEGVADALTVAAAVPDGAVACAFNADNVLAIAAALRERCPAAAIVIAADADDAGRKVAAKAAAADPRLIVRPPQIAAGALVGGKTAKDFDDLRQLSGLDEVRRQLLAEPPADPAAPADTLTLADPTPAAPLPDLPEVFPYGDGAFVRRSGGIFYSPPDDAKGNAQPDRWICGRLDVLAVTRDPAGLDWGRLLAWRDPDGGLHRWAAPLELLQGDGAEIRRELARRGLPIAAGRSAHDLLAAYIQAAPVKTRARCVDRLGWIGGAFVLPDEVIGEADGGEEVVFQGRMVEAAHAIAGSVDDWRGTVAALALGNSRAVFTIGAALAGPLLHLVGGEGGGFHLRGRSSSGKSTAIFAGASVWGPPAFVRPWRATASGLEGVALLHNDMTLFLDELAECDPRQAAEAVYMLANGRGKARAAATGAARPSARWRCLFVSTGETSLEAQAATVGRRIAAGQEVRLADVEADAGAGMGAFEQLHGQPSPAAFALAVRDAAAQHYGAAGVAWLRWLVANRTTAAGDGGGLVARFVADVVPFGASGQVVRVARRFGLVAAAGELATQAGLTDWPPGEAMHSAQACFAAWLANFGAGDREELAMLNQVRSFFEAHGASRFEDIGSDHGQRVPNRAGFYRQPEGAGSVRTYMVLPGVFRNEVCAGLDFKTAVRALVARGWLEPGHDRNSQPLSAPGMGKKSRFYVLTERLWEGIPGDD